MMPSKAPTDLKKMMTEANHAEVNRCCCSRRASEDRKLVLPRHRWHPSRRWNAALTIWSALSILDRLERRIGGRRLLASSDGRSGWPDRGVYFFMEDGERRTDSGGGLRVVRVGTHALTSSSRTTLWKRLSQHKGKKASGGGNHGLDLTPAGRLDFLKHPARPAQPGESRTVRRKSARARAASNGKSAESIGAMPLLWLGNR